MVEFMSVGRKGNVRGMRIDLIMMIRRFNNVKINKFTFSAYSDQFFLEGVIKILESFVFIEKFGILWTIKFSKISIERKKKV